MFPRNEFQTLRQPQQLIGFHSPVSVRETRKSTLNGTKRIPLHCLIRFDIACKNTARALPGHYTNFAAHGLPSRSTIRNGATMTGVITALQRFLHALRLLRRRAISPVGRFFPRISNPTRNIFSLHSDTVLVS